MVESTTKDSHVPKIVDIRKTVNSNTTENLTSQIHKALSKPTVVFPTLSSGNEDKLIRSIPTMVLYDDKGLEIFNHITYLDEYYLTNAEIDIFKRFGDKLVENYVKPGGIIIELGVGSMRKTKYILDSIVKQGKKVTYYALDLSKASLLECLVPLSTEYPSIEFIGLHGTYDDSLEYFKTLDKQREKLVLWIGSSIGNFDREQAGEFCQRVSNSLNPGDLFVVGIDKRNEPKKVKSAYDDSKGLTRDFILNGLVHVNALFNHPSFNLSNFEYVSIYNSILGRHEAYYKSLVNQTIAFPGSLAPVELAEGEYINVEYSYKYSAEEVYQVLNTAQLNLVDKLSNHSEIYDVWISQKANFWLGDCKKGAPSLGDFKQVFQSWQTVKSMIGDVHEKPISLRHPFIFYFGHLPAFVDIQLSKYFNEAYTEPSYFKDIFERGIDPDIEDPSICHPHSQVPNEWPSIQEINEYDNRVWKRLETLYQYNSKFDPRLERILHMGFEHYLMHIETLLYMILQSKNISPPKSIHPPVFRNQSQTILPAALLKIAGGEITIGIDDPEEEDFHSDEPLSVIGWDNEKPARKEFLPDFEIQSRPVTVGEYYEFFMAQKKDESLFPCSWYKDSAGIKLKTAFGLVELASVWKLPVFVSQVQAQAYAEFYGLDLPTETQLLQLKRLASVPKPQSFIPQPLDTFSSKLQFPRDGWELTSTVFDNYPGFIASKLYPGYSADFFDTKHNSVVGGSWATWASGMNRDSFRNWYQRGYGYGFFSFRCVLKK